jgi:glyoxalase superfamily protein
VRLSRLADLDAVAVGIGNPGRAHAARDGFDRAELYPARGCRGEPLVEVVDEQRHHRPTGPVGVAQHIQPAAARELPGGLVVIGEHRRRSAEQALVELERGVAVADRDPREHLGERHRSEYDEPSGGAHTTWRDYYLSIGVPEEALGDGDAVDRLVDPSGRGPAIWFQQVPERKTLKNRLHLDLKVGGGRSVPLSHRRSRVDALVADLSAAGASVIRVNDRPEQDHYAVLMGDPEGNEFDVV